MEDFRNQSYTLQNGREQLVVVQREEFVSQVIGVYKNPEFNLEAKPQVVFIGEPGKPSMRAYLFMISLNLACQLQGRDVGALQKEFFWNGMSCLISGTYEGLPIFEGEDDHKLPCCDSVLLRSGIFSAVGKFLCHSAIHNGVAALGISEAVAEYLTTSEVSYDTAFTISDADIPDFDTRNKLGMVCPCRSLVVCINHVAVLMPADSKLGWRLGSNN
jgi:hypothetical protein